MPAPPRLPQVPSARFPSEAGEPIATVPHPARHEQRFPFRERRPAPTEGSQHLRRRSATQNRPRPATKPAPCVPAPPNVLEALSLRLASSRTCLENRLVTSREESA